VPRGLLLVYDFSPGRFPGDAGWFAGFHERYPPPPSEGRALSPEILAREASPFVLGRHSDFTIRLLLTPGFYLNYILTETNVASAVRRGVPEAEVRSWCAETLAPLWAGDFREVSFHGYFACLVAP
jgi:hypothetical protein